MTSPDQSHSTVLFTGASRGFGRAIVSARPAHGRPLVVKDVGQAAVDLVVWSKYASGACRLTAAGCRASLRLTP
jgi:NAD(P)-dependent dehydrogenase (short-subunit alcohol dehydrogenase family)